jgi:hypothetical protein
MIAPPPDDAADLFEAVEDLAVEQLSFAAPGRPSAHHIPSATDTASAPRCRYDGRLQPLSEADPKEPALIKTMRSEGYILTADVILNGAPW